LSAILVLEFSMSLLLQGRDDWMERSGYKKASYDKQKKASKLQYRYNEAHDLLESVVNTTN
jgi:hypothetical protein